ncbi:MAG: divalent metal cation transporter [Acidimicrobiaceae bacterium]|nr:divalent metal cation transporter [Acidimicrobiaceae bacterium]
MADASRRGTEEAVVTAIPTGLAERRNVLDRAHRGDIVGALGRIDAYGGDRPRSLRRRLRMLLVVMGPGLVVMAGSNDAGSVSTFAQTGLNYGLRWLWLLPLLGAGLFVVQEMVARLGAVTGAGHARLIFERFGRRWGSFALADLFLLNLLTMVTEFIGLQLGLGYFGVSRFVAVPLGALTVVGLTATGSFRGWERAMFVLVAGNFTIIPLVTVVHGLHRSAGVLSVGAAHQHGSLLLLALALVGATVSPWQLFLQQSSVVDKRITTRWLWYERLETAVGAAVFALGAAAILVVCGVAFRGMRPGGFLDAGRVAHDLGRTAGQWAGGLFAIVLIDGSLLGAGLITLANAYAVGDVAGVRHSLHRTWPNARAFYAVYAGCVVVAAGIVLAGYHVLALVTLAVQALAGVLFPSAAVFLLLLCNDRDVLGPWTNPRWLNVVAGALIAALLVLSGLLTVKSIVPQLRPSTTVEALGGTALGIAVLTAVVWSWLRAPRATAPASVRADEPRQTWTMPSLHRLPPPAPSRARTAGLVVLRLYLGVVGVTLVVRALEMIARGG